MPYETCGSPSGRMRASPRLSWPRRSARKAASPRQHSAHGSRRLPPRRRRSPGSVPMPASSPLGDHWNPSPISYRRRSWTRTSSSSSAPSRTELLDLVTADEPEDQPYIPVRDRTGGCDRSPRSPSTFTVRWRKSSRELQQAAAVRRPGCFDRALRTSAGRNPTLDVFHRSTGEVVSDDLSSHVDPVGWHRLEPRHPSFPESLGQVPDHPDRSRRRRCGDIFVINDSEGERRLDPEYV